MKRLLSIAVFFAFATSTAFSQGQTARLRGTIVSLDGNVLTVSALGTNSKVTLADGFRVNWIVKSDLSKIAVGSYIGAAALPQPDGTLRAQEVFILPEASRGSGEGFRPYDLTPQSTMTNATVADIAPTVVDKVEGRSVLLKYKDGEKRLVISADTPVVTSQRADRSALVPGGHVVLAVTKQADGTLSAGGVNVGKDGLVPPM